MREWLRGAFRRTIIYNRQPRKLAALPSCLAATAVAVYVIWTGSGDVALLMAMLALAATGFAIDAIWWLVVKLRRPGSSIPF